MLADLLLQHFGAAVLNLLFPVLFHNSDTQPVSPPRAWARAKD